MKITDRTILKEFIKFTILALICLVALYLIIDLFEELSYFTRRKVEFAKVLLYYFFLTPQAVTLLLPVSLILASFLVYGMMTRQRELYAYMSSGINVYRLFLPILSVAVISIFASFLHRELVEIPFSVKLSDLKQYQIESRSRPDQLKRRNVYYIGETGMVYYIREYEASGILRNFYVLELDQNRMPVRRIDAVEAVFKDDIWQARDVYVREFLEQEEKLSHYDSLILSEIKEKPDDFLTEARKIEEISTRTLYRYLKRMKRAGEKVNKEDVEFNFRFSDSFIGLIVILLALPLSTRLRRGGVMLGLGLGLLFSFLYWGMIQVTKAFGYIGALTPVMSAWLPNILFALVALFFWLRLKR